MNFKIFKSIVFILAFIGVSNTVNAITVCALSCPSSPVNPGTELPQLVEFYSAGNLDLVLDNDGLIFLDESLFNSLAGLTIDSGTTVYTSIGDVPNSVFIPDVLQLSENKIGVSGDTIFSGTQVDYILMVNFFDADILNLSSTQGIVLVNAAALTAVPLPAAFWLFISGASLFLGVSRKRAIVS